VIRDRCDTTKHLHREMDSTDGDLIGLRGRFDTFAARLVAVATWSLCWAKSERKLIWNHFRGRIDALYFAIDSVLSMCVHLYPRQLVQERGRLLISSSLKGTVDSDFLILENETPQIRPPRPPPTAQTVCGIDLKFDI